MHRIYRPSGLSRLAVLIVVLVAAACEQDPQAAAAPTPAAPAADAPGECIDGGRLSVALFGSVDGDIDWQPRALSCEGMPRPHGEGARLRFAGPHPSGTGLLVVIAAIPALARDTAAGELAASLTLIEEGRSRFFATTDFDACWIELLSNEPLDAARQRVRGRVSCITPLGEVGGTGTVSLRDLQFTGVVDWEAS